MGIFAKLFNKNSEEVSSKKCGRLRFIDTRLFPICDSCKFGYYQHPLCSGCGQLQASVQDPHTRRSSGAGRKNRLSRKMLMQDYGISENFFKEIDASVKKHCRTQNDVQGYLFMYQGFSNDLMMLMGNLMQWKFRMPSIFKGALRSMTEKTVHEVCTKAVWKKTMYTKQP